MKLKFNFKLFEKKLNVKNIDIVTPHVATVRIIWCQE